MIASEKEREFEKMLSFLEYHAAFTNGEGVSKARQYRESQKDGFIKETEEFVESAKANDFKNNPLIEAIKKIREAGNKNQMDDNIFNSINLNKLIKEDM